MTSLSKGILKKRGADPVPYSEASLEFFEPPEKKTAAEPVLPEEEPEDDVPETEEEQEEAVQEEARLRSSAELLLEQARRKAESLLLEATKEAERIKEQASKEGYRRMGARLSGGKGQGCGRREAAGSFASAGVP